MSHPDFQHFGNSGLRIDLHLQHTGRIGIGRRWPNTGAAETAGRTRRNIRTCRAERTESGFRNNNCLVERDRLVRVFRREDRSICKYQRVLRQLHVFCNGLGNFVARSFRRLYGGLPNHQRHTRGITAEVHRRQVRVTDTQANILEIDPQHFGDHDRQDAVRALPALTLTTKDRDVAAAIEFYLHTRLRHVIPVNWQTGAGHVGAARQSEPPPLRQFSVTLFPAAALDDGLDTLLQPDGADTQPVRRDRVRLNKISQTQLRRINSQFVGGFIELNFKTETRLWRAMTSLGPTRWFVGKRAGAFEPVIRQLVGRRLQRTGVKRTGDAVTAERATVECRT